MSFSFQKLNRDFCIAVLAIVCICVYLILEFVYHLPEETSCIPLFIGLMSGGIPLVFDLLKKAFRGEFGSDFLAAISIVTAFILHEYLAGVLVVLMLSGGEALENYALNHASDVLRVLAKRMPLIAHRKLDGHIEEVKTDQINIGDMIVIYPHEISPVDGVVTEGHGSMDESFLTGEPFIISKLPGSQVISGAINADNCITIRATKKAIDSRYAKIMEVMKSLENKRPRIRRLADHLGGFYTPIAVALAVGAWFISHDPVRFLSVLVVATPCPLLIAIPVAIIGSISLAAHRGIVIKNPSVLEQINQCRVMILDKTGTLTYGKPVLTKEIYFNGHTALTAMRYAASLEFYSKHPLAEAIIKAAHAQKLSLMEVVEINESPGEGLKGTIEKNQIEITGRNKLLKSDRAHIADQLLESYGLECVVLVNGQLAAQFIFYDQPREHSRTFIRHLKPLHHIKRVIIVSGDREQEVKYLADHVGIHEIYAQQSPEEKVKIVERETKLAKTIFVGDGINDAPALMVATVGIAFGQNSDITTEAAGTVIMDNSIEKIDELFHISDRMMNIALQSAVGGMLASIIGMGFAAAGILTPVMGAIVQEAIDLFAVLNALRVALPPKDLTDFHKAQVT